MLLILALSSARLGAGPSAAQQPQFSTRVTQVAVYATVTAAEGSGVRGLTRDDFELSEDNVPQRITAFTTADFPAAVALAVDRSVSMRGAPLTMARTAGRAFIAWLKPTDRAMLISISGEVDVLAPMNADKTPLLQALDTLDPWSTTSLHDAIIRCLDLLESETGRRAVVVLSDGVDRYSKAREADVVNRARESDVLIYPVAIGRTRPPLFAELATVSGGRSFHLRDPKELQPTLQAIVQDLRAQYVLGYEPSRPWPSEAAEWRSISVVVHRPGVRVRARSGYSTARTSFMLKIPESA